MRNDYLSYLTRPIPTRPPRVGPDAAAFGPHNRRYKNRVGPSNSRVAPSRPRMGLPTSEWPSDNVFISECRRPASGRVGGLHDPGDRLSHTPGMAPSLQVPKEWRLAVRLTFCNVDENGNCALRMRIH